MGFRHVLVCGSGRTKHVSRLMSATGASAKEVLDAVQTALDSFGMAPVIGEPADAISGVISALRGDYTGAVLSACALNPFGGQACGAGKLARRVGSAIDNARDLGRAGERAAGISDAPKKAIEVGGRKLFPDEVSRATRTLTEVKNVGKLSYTRQLRDYNTFAKTENLKFILVTRPGTKLSGPLRRAIDAGDIIHKPMLPFGSDY